LQEDYHEHCFFGGEILQLGEIFLDDEYKQGSFVILREF
jgi:hypothetical protein